MVMLQENTTKLLGKLLGNYQENTTKIHFPKLTFQVKFYIFSQHYQALKYSWQALFQRKSVGNILLTRVSSKENEISLTLQKQELAFCCRPKIPKILCKSVVQFLFTLGFLQYPSQLYVFRKDLIPSQTFFAV